MTSFHEVRFPEGISYGAVGGPGFKTTIIVLSSGHEKRNVDWQNIRCEFDVSHGLKDKQQFIELQKFFYARRGRAYGFRYKDWTDYELHRQSIGFGNGTNTNFQVFKRYSSGGENYDRVLTKIVAGTPRVWVEGVEVTTGFTLNLNTGLITFDVAPANNYEVEVSCEFDVPCRFDTDVLAGNIEFFDTYNWPNIPIVEIRV